ncbi:MAG TPA: phosphoglycerate dehydrogenase [Rhodospirillaceae bacterium]|jgi:D-3-phosphoglycerate dehydrogenase|nr:phosphoglycerate dehydrogenase [Alphaproteobacteria bacterium]HBH27091.1 phosphoglycerate dehydrogenase [Rhodospirillaceae bacterium]
MPKVLIADKLAPRAAEILREAGVETDVKTGLPPEELKAIIGAYDGLAIRSATKVTAEIIAAATNLKVIARAGIGVDNVDIPAATQAGIVVMNTPFGNTTTTAEHAIAMMFAAARQIPAASASTHAGKWEKSKFMGREISGKTLGLIGAGNIGSIVADRAQGLKMRVIAYDPYLTEERALALGVERVSLEDLYKRADVITLHVPKTKETAHMIDAGALAAMKKGVILVNCARGGLVDEAALRAALDSGHVGAAAFDVFSVEPAKENVLFGHPNVVCTPHLGAATAEAQDAVAIQAAEQIAAYLTTGAVTNALNTASVSAQDAPRLQPYLKLGAALGKFAGQITGSAIRKVDIAYEGTVTDVNTDPIAATILANLLAGQVESVNLVNALQVAQARGIEVKQSYDPTSRNWRSMIEMTVTSDERVRNVTGTLFTGREPRLVNVEGVPIEVALTAHMLFIRNRDEPGLVGAVGCLLGDAGINIADFRLGRQDEGGAAVCVINLDAPLPDDVFADIKALPHVVSAKRLAF